MIADDLKGWLQEYTRENNPVSCQWELVVRVIQFAFTEGTFPEELT